MSWDYRVVHRREVFPGVIGAEDVYAIHEVFYNDQNRPNGVSASPAPVQAGTLAGLNEVRMLMAIACQKPVLEWDEIAVVRHAAPVPPR